MLRAVQPRGNGFGGGAYVGAGRPTDVGGGGFASPGTASALPGVPNSGIIEARNNRGTNVQIPYARLVPMHARENKHYKEDPRGVIVDGKTQLEYDGLRSGELGWVLGRRFKSVSGGDAAAEENLQSGDLSALNRLSNLANAGMGSGVDRMQRMASTGWVEGFIQQKLGSATVNLHEIKIGSPYNVAVDAGISALKTFAAGATAIHGPDIARSVATAGGITGNKLPPERLQGIFVAEQGPFLRGMQVGSELYEAEPVMGVLPSTVVRLARHEGDNLSFAALDAELRRRNLLNWSPDGVVLSKLESPTDEPMKSTELDARGAQLFNVAVQGPATTTVWTSDFRDHKLECQPMDKVFICLVANLSYNYTADIKSNVEAARASRNAVAAAAKNLHIALRSGDKIASDTATTDLKEAEEKAENAAEALTLSGSEPTEYESVIKELSEVQEAVKAAQPSPAAKDELAKAEKRLRDLFKWAPEDTDKFESVQGAIRLGRTFVRRAVLSNFRLIRSTSSHMSNYSHWSAKDANSRCGLKLGKPASELNGSGVGEYIVGAWCIGTVLDSAASRSTVGAITRTAPTSMALRVNVNVEWWSGDKLYKHYMDDGRIQTRDGFSKKRARAPADMDKDLSYFSGDEDDGDDEDAEGAMPSVSAAAATFPALGTVRPQSKKAAPR